MRPILCVIDLSESTPQVLEVAAKMAYAYKLDLAILFPYRLIDSGYKGEVSKLKATLENEAKEKFHSIKQQLPILNLVTHEFLPEIGFPSDRINAFVRRQKVDSLVISQHQANSMNEANKLALQTLIADVKLPFTIVPAVIDAEVISR